MKKLLVVLIAVLLFIGCGVVASASEVENSADVGFFFGKGLDNHARVCYYIVVLNIRVSATDGELWGTTVEQKSCISRPSGRTLSYIR